MAIYFLIYHTNKEEMWTVPQNAFGSSAYLLSPNLSSFYCPTTTKNGWGILGVEEHMF